MDFDVIERKGIGHPDTIADTLAERLGYELEAFYQEKFGMHLHYNVDKVLVTAGRVAGNEMTKSVNIVFAGQYTPVKAITRILQSVVSEVLDFEIRHGMRYRIYNMLNPGAVDLTENFNVRKSNDTSFAVGSPLTDNERLAISIGSLLDGLHMVNDFFGRDNKLMLIEDHGVKKAYIAIACLRGSDKDYVKEVWALKQRIESEFGVDATINSAGMFVTLTGTSLEQGDSGMTGRGNRYNGLITPLRPMTMEAYAGKNNQTHIGRIYQKRAHEHAQKHGKKVIMLNKIGHDIEKPEVFEWEA